MWNNYKKCQAIAADGVSPYQKDFHQRFLSTGHNELIHDCQNIFIDKMELSDLTRGNSFGWGYLKPYPHWVIILTKFTIINLNLQIISHFGMWYGTTQQWLFIDINFKCKLIFIALCVWNWFWFCMTYSFLRVCQHLIKPSKFNSSDAFQKRHKINSFCIDFSMFIIPEVLGWMQDGTAGAVERYFFLLGKSLRVKKS